MGWYSINISSFNFFLFSNLSFCSGAVNIYCRCVLL